MRYQHIPKSLFEKFVKEICLDHSRCDYVKIKNMEAGQCE